MYVEKICIHFLGKHSLTKTKIGVLFVKVPHTCRSIYSLTFSHICIYMYKIQKYNSDKKMNF